MILKGYGKLCLRIIRFSITAGLVMGVTVLLVTPLWYAATRHTFLYTTVMLAGMGAGLILFLGWMWGRSLRFRGGVLPWIREVMLPGLGKASLGILGIGVIYLILLLTASGAYLPALGTALAGLMGGGYLYYRPSSRQ